MRMIRRADNKVENIERDFFKVDEETGAAIVRLHFERPEEMFDLSCESEIPIFNDDFNERLTSTFAIIPEKYPISLEIAFDDMGDYAQDELKQIFRKNCLFSARSLSESVHKRDRLAFALLFAGFISFALMILIHHLWGGEGILHEMFFYLLDIATTVLFWEAVGILLVETREHRAIVREYRERFSSVQFIRSE